jgi:dihydrodipicolinate synthase/N-acetylneuraminate lyase
MVKEVKKDCGLVIWGVGDRSTAPAQQGTRGHTSGINVVFARASDEINNAQRRGDWESSRRIEAELAPLEEIRFRQGRMYNYAAVVEAMRLGGFGDVDGGEGGPFNAPVPPEVAREVEAAIEKIRHYH